MRKKVLVLLCVFSLINLFPAAAKADIGPKPSVTVDFTGFEGEQYYATLLSSEQSTGPYSALEGANDPNARYEKGDADYDIYVKFLSYEDADGFYFFQYFQDCSQTRQFTWTYYPPQTFKILLYFPQTDRFVSSGPCERYAFDSYFTARADDGAGLKTTRSYDYGGEILSLIVRVVLTIGAELGIALLFGLRQRRQIRFIALVNGGTQIALNVALNIINYHMGALGMLFFYLLLEAAVFIAEAVLYGVFLRKFSEKPLPGWKPWVYALAANAASFALGLFLALWLPGIF